MFNSNVRIFLQLLLWLLLFFKKPGNLYITCIAYGKEPGDKTLLYMGVEISQIKNLWRHGQLRKLGIFTHHCFLLIPCQVLFVSLWKNWRVIQLIFPVPASCIRANVIFGHSPACPGARAACLYPFCFHDKCFFCSPFLLRTTNL